MNKISAGLSRVKAKTEPDAKDELEQFQLQSEIDDSIANRHLRETYAKRVFGYLLGYSAFCALVIVFQGFRWWSFQLDAIPFTTLIGSTAVAAIGLVSFVVKGLFAGPPTRRRKG